MEPIRGTPGNTEAGIQPGMDASTLQSIVHTLLHTLIHIFLGGGNKLSAKTGLFNLQDMICFDFTLICACVCLMNYDGVPAHCHIFYYFSRFPCKNNTLQ